MRNKQLKLYLTIIGFCLGSSGAVAQSPAPDAAELTKLLNDFLVGASRSDVQMHDRFWADDLIYTRSAGRRVTKAEVMRDVRSAPASQPSDPRTTYTAQDVRIQQYGSTAIVAFRLVATTESHGTTQVANLLNSGTFLKRDGKWQVVNWQSTRMPLTPEAAKHEATQAHDVFFRAMLNGDVKTLANLTADSFSVTHSSGTQDPRAQFLQRLSSGLLKYTKLERTNVVVSVTGDTAVVRGIASVQTADAPAGIPPRTVAYTLVFANQGGSWRAVALVGNSGP
jgi:ketosteroid isomerase-like protein